MNIWMYWEQGWDNVPSSVKEVTARLAPPA